MPVRVSEVLCRDLRRDASEATHFELVVGRFLQVLGATKLEYQLAGAESRRVDWLAHFPDGLVSVEATVPVVNEEIDRKLQASQLAVDTILSQLPPGWWLLVHRVPRFSPNEPSRRFKKWAKSALSEIPHGSPGKQLSLNLSFEELPVSVVLLGANDPTQASRVGAGPGVGFIDDSSEAVRRAIAGKRRQARGAPKPVIAAIYTAGFGSFEIEKYDIALFGRSVENIATGEVRFDASGVFGMGNGEPTFAGALAFANLGMRGGPDPVLYLHPRYSGGLPEGLMQLRRRELTADGIRQTPAAADGILARLGWPIL